jgi:hypothetical protein
MVEDAEIGKTKEGRTRLELPPVDPTKNVLDLVAAEHQYQEGMRGAQNALQHFAVGALEKQLTALHDAESRIQNWMRDSEMKRIAETNSQRQFYETRIADMLRTSVESTSTLVSTQLVQIQNTFNERVAKLEQFRWESGGRTSVSDPALADILNKLTIKLNEVQLSSTQTTSRGTGRSDMIAWAISGLLFLMTAASFLVNYNKTPPVPPPPLTLQSH